MGPAAMEAIAALPCDVCVLTLERCIGTEQGPFVATQDGWVFQDAALKAYLSGAGVQQHDVPGRAEDAAVREAAMMNPVSGTPLGWRVQLVYTFGGSNDAEEKKKRVVCPVSRRVLGGDVVQRLETDRLNRADETPATRPVSACCIRTTGRVYAQETIEQLCLVPGRLVDPVEGTPFQRADVLVLYDAAHPTRLVTAVGPCRCRWPSKSGNVWCSRDRCTGTRDRGGGDPCKCRVGGHVCRAAAKKSGTR